MSELTAAHSALEKAREVTNCPQGVDLHDHLKQLVAENLSMKAICDDRRMFIMNGVQLGYIQVPTMEVDPALETIRIAVSPQEPTPATDSILRAAEAQGVEKFASDQRQIAEHWRAKIGNTVGIERSIGIAEEAEAFAQYLRVVKS